MDHEKLKQRTLELLPTDMAGYVDLELDWLRFRGDLDERTVESLRIVISDAFSAGMRAVRDAE